MNMSPDAAKYDGEIDVLVKKCYAETIDMIIARLNWKW